MATVYDVIVVGGGAVGAACARELALAGHRVLVLERGTSEGAAWRAAAGMLAPQVESKRDDPLFELGLAGRERYKVLAPSLRDTTGVDIGFWQEGINRVAEDEAEAAELKSRVAWQRQQGHLCDWLDATEVAARWPWVGRTHGALWAPCDAALDPENLVEALLADAALHGATILHDAARALDRQGDRIVGVVGQSNYAAGHVVLAAGAWTGQLEQLPRPVSVEPVRGQMAALNWPAGVERSILYGKDCYVVHRRDEAVVGSTVEYAGYRPEVTSQGIAGIFSAVSALCPALAGAAVKRSWAGLRPVTPDGLPIIGREPRVEGLWYATGHGRSGILLASITGAIIAQLLAGTTTPEVSHLAPERFWSG